MSTKKIPLSVGSRFGRLIVLAETTLDGSVAWRCRCDCGNATVARGPELRSGHRIGCGCGNRPLFSGKRFGRLLVIGAGIKYDRPAWRCRCDCGQEIVAASYALSTGKRSCGCERAERVQVARAARREAVAREREERRAAAATGRATRQLSKEQARQAEQRRRLQLAQPRKRWARFTWHTARRRAAAKGLAFELSVESVIEMATATSVCCLEGLSLEYGRKDGDHRPRATSPTLDRINNSKGYVPGNVRILSWLANRRKSDLGVAQLDRYTADAHANVLHASLLSRSIMAAARLHEGQTDKGGHPAILHALRVGLAGRTEEEMVLGVLHDTVEDAGWDAIRALLPGMPVWLVEALDAISRRPGERYESYLDRVRGNLAAAAVKLKDLADNADLSRITNPTERDRARVEKYQRAIVFLEHP